MLDTVGKKVGMKLILLSGIPFSIPGRSCNGIKKATRKYRVKYHDDDGGGTRDLACGPHI